MSAAAAAVRRKHRAIWWVRHQLVERFPAAFRGPEIPKPPLKRGIHRDLRQRWPEVKPWQLHAALGDYMAGPSYLRSFVAGAERVDLDGNVVAIVTEAEIEHAREALARVEAERAGRKRQEPAAAEKGLADV